MHPSGRLQGSPVVGEPMVWPPVQSELERPAVQLEPRHSAERSADEIRLPKDQNGGTLGKARPDLQDIE